jgi:predicted dinucleotide-binding enzyme
VARPAPARSPAICIGADRRTWLLVGAAIRATPGVLMLPLERELTLGFDPVDVGPLRNAAHLESLAILWIHLATVGKRGRDFAFKALAR